MTVGLKAKEPEWEDLLVQVERLSGENSQDWEVRVMEQVMMVLAKVVDSDRKERLEVMREGLACLGLPTTMAVYDQVDSGNKKMDRSRMMEKLTERMREEVKLWVEEETTKGRVGAGDRAERTPPWMALHIYKSVEEIRKLPMHADLKHNIRYYKGIEKEAKSVTLRVQWKPDEGDVKVCDLEVEAGEGLGGALEDLCRKMKLVPEWMDMTIYRLRDQN